MSLCPIFHYLFPRYADVVVHRLLGAAIGISKLPHQLTDKALIRGVGDQINYRHRNAQMAGRASVELFTLIFFKDRSAVTDARIVKVRAPPMFSIHAYSLISEGALLWVRHVFNSCFEWLSCRILYSISSDCKTKEDPP